MTPYTGHLTPDTWHMTHGLGWTFLREWRFIEDIFTKDDSITDLIGDRGVCRTAPATPGLFTITWFRKKNMYSCCVTYWYTRFSMGCPTNSVFTHWCDALSHPFPSNYQNTFSPKPQELWTYNFLVCSFLTTCTMPCVACQVSCVICQVSQVTWQEKKKIYIYIRPSKKKFFCTAKFLRRGWGLKCHKNTQNL